MSQLQPGTFKEDFGFGKHWTKSPLVIGATLEIYAFRGSNSSLRKVVEQEITGSWYCILHNLGEGASGYRNLKPAVTFVGKFCFA